MNANLKGHLPSSQTSELAAAIEVTLVHGITGRPVEESTLPAGAVISAWVTILSDTGEVNLFLASEDLGKSWFRYYSYARPQTRPINPKFVTCDDGAVVAQSTGPKPPASARKAIR